MNEKDIFTREISQDEVSDTVLYRKAKQKQRGYFIVVFRILK